MDSYWTVETIRCVEAAMEPRDAVEELAIESHQTPWT